MPFVDIKDLPVGERLPGWRDRTFHSGNVTIAHYTFDQDASIHEHWHPNEEVWNVIEGGLEVTIGAAVKVAGPGFAAVVPPNTPHSVLALSNGRAMVVDYPIRRFDTNRQRAGLTIDFSNPVALPDAKNGGVVAIRFKLRSWAQMPALVKDFRVETGVSPSLPPPIAPKIPDGDLPTSRTILPGESWDICPQHRGLTAEDSERIRSGTPVFYIRGGVVYDDSNSIRYHAVFCKVYNPARFNGVGGFLSPDLSFNHEEELRR